MRPLFVFAVALVLGACSDPDSNKADNPGSQGGTGQSGAAGGAGTPGLGGSSGMAGGGGSTAARAGTGGTDSAATACNNLVADAPDYFITIDPGAAPTPLGGTIVDGTYFAKSSTIYGFASSLTADGGSARVVIAGDSWEEIDGQPADDTVDPDQTFSLTYTTAATQITLVYSCPAADQHSYGYTADGSGFSLYITDQGTQAAIVFERQ